MALGAARQGCRGHEALIVAVALSACELQDQGMGLCIVDRQQYLMGSHTRIFSALCNIPSRDLAMRDTSGESSHTYIELLDVLASVQGDAARQDVRQHHLLVLQSKNAEEEAVVSMGTLLLLARELCLWRCDLSSQSPLTDSSGFASKQALTVA